MRRAGGESDRCRLCSFPCQGPHSPTLTKRRLYLRRLLALPVGFLGLSCLGTLGHCPRTLPARAREPWTLPAGSSTVKRLSANPHGLLASLPHPGTAAAATAPPPTAISRLQAVTSSPPAHRKAAFHTPPLNRSTPQRCNPIPGCWLLCQGIEMRMAAGRPAPIPPSTPAHPWLFDCAPTNSTTDNKRKATVCACRQQRARPRRGPDRRRAPGLK